MSPTAQLQAFAQSVYRALKGHDYDDLTSSDGQIYLAQVIDALNLYLDELETTVDNESQPVDWVELLRYASALGTATSGTAAISLATSIANILTGEQRYIQVLQDGTPVSNWAVVEPNQIASQALRVTEDMVARVGNSLVFSRNFRDSEAGGSIIGDYSIQYPRVTFTSNSGSITPTNVSIFTDYARSVPRQLLVLGVAKNMVLPDIVQGGLSPSYTQKYQDLLTGKIARNMSTSRADVAVRDDLSGVRGVY